MYLIAATFVVLLVLTLLDLLEKKMNGAPISLRSWLMALSLPTIVSGVFLVAYLWLEANLKIAHAPVPDWFGFGLCSLLVGGFFFASVLERLEYENVSHSEETVGLAGMISIFASFALLAKFDLSGWFLLLLIPIVWVTLGGLWSGFVSLAVWLAEHVFHRKTKGK
jgi:hypothetical protein